MKRNRTASTIHKTVVSAVVLLSLFIIAGLAYVLITDLSGTDPAATIVPAKTDQTPDEFKPKTPAANASEGAAVQSITSPVQAGSNSSVNIATTAGSTCKIAVSYNNVPSKDSGLMPQVADAYGNVQWSFTVDKSAALGKWPVKVTCMRNGKTGYVEGTLEVTR